MTDYCKSVGPSLVSNGYLVVPIRRGEKRPAISSWEKARLTAAEISGFGGGVGVLCGVGEHPIVGVDVDISHPAISQAVVAWCREHLGETAERVGAAPRLLLAYRAAGAGWTKGHSLRFFDPADPLKPSGKRNDQQVEILGAGQQFVAYHVHPDTGREYAWTDLMGGLACWPAAALPVVTPEQIAALLAAVRDIVRTTPGLQIEDDGQDGWKIDRFPTSPLDWFGTDSLAGLVPRLGMALAEARAKVAKLPNDDDDYFAWLEVGQALHHEFAGTPGEAEAISLWREYGAKSSKDKPSEYAYKWESFGRYSGPPVTMRSLLKRITEVTAAETTALVRSARDEALALIKEQSDPVALVGSAVTKKLADLIRESPQRSIEHEVFGVFQAQFRALTKTTMPIGEVRALLGGPRVPTVRQKRPLTEFGNAERMLDRFGDGLMYVPETDTWYIWTGVYWRPAVKVEIEHLAKETIKGLVDEADEHIDQQGEFFGFCALSQQARMVSNMVRLACSDPRVAVPARELDRHSHFLGVQNGVVDLRTGNLLPPDQSYRITMVTSCDYVPAATCPRFETAARQSFFDDLEMVDYFYRTLGYSMMGNPREEVMFIPFGNGANGKSTLLNTVREVMGRYARSAEAASFVSDAKPSNAGGPREDLVRLRGARFVYVNEPDEAGELREGTVKSMTGGDAITARGVHAPNSIEMTPTWAVWMPTNHKPIVKGSDNGIWRRLVLLPFTRNFAADPNVPQDRQLKDKLLQEKEGVLALLVRAAIAYQERGLAPPRAVQEASQDYRSQMDLLGEWLDECCDIRPGAETPTADLWASWKAFAEQKGLLSYIKSDIALGRRLESRFPLKRTKTERKRIGIALKVLF